MSFVELLFVGFALLWGHVLEGLCMGLLLLFVFGKSLLKWLSFMPNLKHVVHDGLLDIFLPLVHGLQ